MADPTAENVATDDFMINWGSDGLRVDNCGTCDRKKLNVALFEQGGVVLCSHCLRDLANVLDSKVAP